MEPLPDNPIVESPSDPAPDTPVNETSDWQLEAPAEPVKRRRRRAKAKRRVFTNKPARAAGHVPYRRPRVNVEVVDAYMRSNRIKEFLLAKGITQEEMSRRVGTSYRHANRISLGKSLPSHLLVHRIAAVLGEPPDAIFQVEVETRPAHRGGSRMRTYTRQYE